MVAQDREDRDTCIPKTTHFAPQVDPSAVIFPVSIVEITSDEHEGHPGLDRQVNELRQRSSACPTKLLHRSSFIARQSSERTVEMEVGGVNELKHGQDQANI